MSSELKDDCFSGDLERVLRQDHDEILCLALSSHGILAIGTTGPASTLVYGCRPDGKLVIAHGTELSSTYYGATTALAFSPSGDLLVTGDIYGRIHIWDINSQTETNTFSLSSVWNGLPEDVEVPEKEDWVTDIVCNNKADNQFAAVVGRFVHVFSCDGTPPKSISVQEELIHTPAWLPDGILVCVTGATIYPWRTSIDPASGSPHVVPLQNLPSEARRHKIISCAGSPSGRLAVGYDDGTIKILFCDHEKGLKESRQFFNSIGPVTSFVWNVSGQYLCASSLSSGKSAVWDLTKKMAEPSSIYTPAEPLVKVAFNKTLPMMVAINASGRLFVYRSDEQSGRPIFGPCAEISELLSKSNLSTSLMLDWHPCGHIITVLPHQGQLCFWRIANARALKALSSPVYEKADDAHNLANIMVGERKSLSMCSPDDCRSTASCHSNNNGDVRGKPDTEVTFAGNIDPIAQHDCNGEDPMPNDAILSASTSGDSAPVTPQALPRFQRSTIPSDGSSTSPPDPLPNDAKHESKTSFANPPVKSMPYAAQSTAEFQASQGTVRNTTMNESIASSGSTSVHMQQGAGSPGAGPSPWHTAQHFNGHPGMSVCERSGPAIMQIPQGMPYMYNGTWYAPQQQQPYAAGVPSQIMSQQAPNVMMMPGGIPGTGQMTQPGTGMPHQHLTMPQWHAFQQQQMVMQQQYWQQQQYMQQYWHHYNQQVAATGAMYSAPSQPGKTIMMQMPSGLVTAVDMHEANYRTEVVSRVSQEQQHVCPQSWPEYVNTLYVGNLAAGINERLLHEAFLWSNEITNIQVIRDKISNMSRGFAFVSFTTAAHALSAMRDMDGIRLSGPFEERTLRIAPSNRNLANGWIN